MIRKAGKYKSAEARVLNAVMANAVCFLRPDIGTEKGNRYWLDELNNSLVKFHETTGKPHRFAKYIDQYSHSDGRVTYTTMED